MRSIFDILQNSEFTCREKRLESIKVKSISSDSRNVSEGAVFVAVKGWELDGHQFIEQAVNRGCVAVVANQLWVDTNNQEFGVPLIGVTDSRVALGNMAVLYYGKPAESMTIIGITGTNGKTTTSYILENIIFASGGKPGVIGTINYRFNGNEMEATHTTPEPVSLQKTLRAMADSGVTHVVMEVSSHALEQKRIAGLHFDLALFTNLTHDHLDYHKNMESYYLAKKELFTKYLKVGGYALIVLEDVKGNGAQKDSWCGRLAHELRVVDKKKNDLKSISIKTCGNKGLADIWVDLEGMSVNGVCGTINSATARVEFESPLVGSFNVKNILSAAGAAFCLGFAENDIKRGVSEIGLVPGRMEKVSLSGAQNSEGEITVFVDYAHTPDALENVLNALHDLKHEKIIVVFGCGGDRDQDKRFLMGKIAGKLADVVIVTADNSRSEETKDIIEEICRGVEDSGKTRSSCQAKVYSKNGYIAVLDRSEAIGVAIHSAEIDDIVLVSGKGHENYQITKKGRMFFDDRQEVNENLANIN